MGRLTHCGEGAGDCLLGGLPSTKVEIERAEEEEEEEAIATEPYLLSFLTNLSWHVNVNGVS